MIRASLFSNYWKTQGWLTVSMKTQAFHITFSTKGNPVLPSPFIIHSEPSLKKKKQMPQVKNLNELFNSHLNVGRLQFLLLLDQVSPCGWARAHCVDQASHKFTETHCLCSWVLGLKACIAMLGWTSLCFIEDGLKTTHWADDRKLGYWVYMKEALGLLSVWGGREGRSLV